LTINRSNEFASLNIIKNNTGNQIVYLGTGSSGADDGGVLQLSDGGTVKAQIYTSGNSYFNGGNVGIGTTSPSYKLHVEGSGTANEIVGWFNNQGNFSTMIAVRNANRTAYLTNHATTGLTIPNYTGQLTGAISLGVGGGGTPIQFYNGSPSSAKMTILETGNVGIGTTTPQSILEVLTSSSTTNAIVSTILVNAKTTGTFAAGFGPAIKFHGSMTGQDNVELGLIGAVNVNGIGAFGELVFYTRPNGPSVERMRITSTGNVGIGTTSPQVKLDVVGDMTVTDGIIKNTVSSISSVGDGGVNIFRFTAFDLGGGSGVVNASVQIQGVIWWGDYSNSVGTIELIATCSNSTWTVHTFNVNKTGGNNSVSTSVSGTNLTIVAQKAFGGPSSIVRIIGNISFVGATFTRL
jgi:hypothetical protein